MSTVRNIERRMFIRRQADRDLQASGAKPLARERGVEWNGVWTGYLVFLGVEGILAFLVLGIGFSSLNPLRAASWADVGGATVVWLAIATFIATYIGAWVAGRTPPATTYHGIGKALPMWGLVVLTMVLMVGYIASQAVTVAAGGVAAVGGAAPAATAAGITQLQTRLQAQGIAVTGAQAARIGALLAAGNSGAAATALSADAAIPLPRATTAIRGLQAAPAGGLTGMAARAGATAARGVRNVGGSLSWGMFWIALITLGCAIAGGATGGGALNRPRLRQAAAPKSAA